MKKKKKVQLFARSCKVYEDPTTRTAAAEATTCCRIEGREHGRGPSDDWGRRLVSLATTADDDDDKQRGGSSVVVVVDVDTDDVVTTLVRPAAETAVALAAIGAAVCSGVLSWLLRLRVSKERDREPRAGGKKKNLREKQKRKKTKKK